jgi:hypothetical protein
MLHARHSSTQVRSVITITGLGDHDDRNPQMVSSESLSDAIDTPSSMNR